MPSGLSTSNFDPACGERGTGCDAMYLNGLSRIVRGHASVASCPGACAACAACVYGPDAAILELHSFVGRVEFLYRAGPVSVREISTVSVTVRDINEKLKEEIITSR